MLQIKDRSGCISVAAMRRHFENAVNQTPVIKAKTPLDIISVKGAFERYANPETQSMWFGFALGMRAAERILAQSQIGAFS
jgi:hypothetical protein